MTKPTNNITDNMDTALTGQYQLNAGEIIKEAWQLTLKNFGRFAPAVAIFIVFVLTIFALLINLQLGGTEVIMQLFDETVPDAQKQQIAEQINISSYIYQILVAPISASMGLMALNHSIGGLSKIKHIFSGFYRTLPLIMMTILSLLLQTISSYLIPLLSLYIIVAFSMAPLLVCERGLPAYQALWVSLRAVNRKIIPIIGIHLLILFVYVVAVLLYGIGIIIALPFHFHLVAVLYRNMFGLKNYAQQSDEASSQDNSSDDTSQSNGHFDA